MPAGLSDSSFLYSSRYLSESDLCDESRAKTITEVVTKIESIDEDTVSWSSLKTPFLFNIKKTINSAKEAMSIAVHNAGTYFRSVGIHNINSPIGFHRLSSPSHRLILFSQECSACFQGLPESHEAALHS